MLKRFPGVITAAREGFSAFVVGLSLATVAGVTGFISYTHISALTLTEHQSWKTAHLMPFAVDGQIVIGSVYFMEHEGRKRFLGLIGIVPGVLESVYANWQSAAVFGWHDALWATVPAQAFACSTFLFERWLHSRRSRVPAAVPEPAAEILPDEIVTVPAVRALPLLHLHPAPQEAPWGLVIPAEPPLPQPALARAVFPQLPVFGPHQPLNGHVKRPRLAAGPSGPDQRLPLPSGPAELEALVTSVSRNELFRDYQTTKHNADKLRKQFGVGQEEASADAA